MTPKFYIEVPVEKELPKEAGEYFTDQGCITWVHDRWFSFQPTWWLKEVDLIELMVKFGIWKNITNENNKELDTWDIVDEFLKSEGIITNNK